MSRSFDELLAEAEAAPMGGWDFGWLAGRATEQRPSWGYQDSMGRKMAQATAALDIQTGGGEVLAAIPKFPKLTVATESWAPNVASASRLLAPLGIAVVADPDEPPLPFGDGVFDLVVSRHPVTVWWEEIARVLQSGGSYFAQHVGPASVFELTEYFLGRQPEHIRRARHSDDARDAATAAGLEVLDLRAETLEMEFFDVGAVVYFLRKVIWIVPDFSVQKYREKLLDLHRLIEAEGRFVAHSSRFLIEARKL